MNEFLVSVGVSGSLCADFWRERLQIGEIEFVKLLTDSAEWDSSLFDVPAYGRLTDTEIYGSLRKRKQSLWIRFLSRFRSQFQT